MKKAFNVSMLGDHDEEMSSSDEDDIWQDNGSDDSMDGVHTERTSCFAHSLQLVVKDGLKDRRIYSAAIAKVSSLATSLHNKTSFKVMSHNYKIILFQ